MCAFQAVENPGDGLVEQHCVLSGSRCHSSLAFIRAHSDPGVTVLSLAQLSGDEMIAGAVGFLERGRLFRTLRIPTLPVVPSGDADGASMFWAGIKDYCREHRVARLILQSFEARSIAIPTIGRVRSTTPRCEYVVRLESDPNQLLKSFSQNHRRNVAKAVKKHLTVEMRRSAEAADRHAEAVLSSADRRRASRGRPSRHADRGAP